MKMQYLLEATLLGTMLSIVQLSTQAWQQQIYVSHIAGIHNESCWSGDYFTPCADLNLALKGAVQHNNATTIFVQPGNYLLLDGRETQFMQKHQMAIIGNTTVPSEVAIHCLSPAGLHFRASQELVIDSLTFNNCAVTHDNQTAQVLYFESCESVTITNAVFRNSIGVAAMFNDTFGNVSITDSLFIGSTCNSFQFECGGIVIEITSNPSNEAISANAYYVLNNTAFIGNNVSVSSPGFNVEFCPKLGTYSYVGMGAGISVLFKGNTTRNQILLLNNTFSGNSANFGGGLLIALCENANENSVRVEQSHFVTNYATSGRTSYQRSGDGGGALVAIENMQGDMNYILFKNCHFSNNSASHGGGLAVVTFSKPKEHRAHSTNNILHITECDLVSNYALLGLALYFYRISFSISGGINVVLSNVDMYNNIPLDNSAPSGSVLYSYNSSITLSEFVSFSKNTDTTILALESSLLVSPNARIVVQENMVLDGRVVVLECSTITVSANSILSFESNKNISVVLYSSCGSNKAELNNECFLQYEKDTIHPDYWNTQFIFHDNTGCSPNEDNWSCSISKSTTPTMIYDTNILSCVWPAENSEFVSKSDLNEIFMWHPFNYSGQYSNNTIMSGPTSLSIQDVFNVTIGERIVFPITVYDYIGNDITGKITFRVCVVGSNYYLAQGNAGDESSCIYTNVNQTLVTFSTNNATMHIDPNIGFQVVHLDFATVGISEVTSRLTTNLYHCQQPFLSPASSNCEFKVCTEQDRGNPIFCRFGSLSTCEEEAFTENCMSKECPNVQNNMSLCNAQSYFSMPYGNCFRADKGTEEANFGYCPPVYANSQQDGLCFPANVFYTNTNNDDGISDNCVQNRTGLLCGQCEDDLCVAINSINFVCAEYSPYGLLIFIVLQILPLTVFLLLLMFFGVSLNYLSTNAYILYAQMVTLWFPGKSYPTWSLIPYWPSKVVFIGVLYSIWSLDFLLALSIEPFCIIPGMTAVQVIAFQYITAAYPLLVAGVTWIWLEMYARGVRPVFYITRPVQHMVARCSQALKIERSLTETFAVMFVLSFTQLARVSVQLLSFSTMSTASNTTNGSFIHQAVFYYDANLGYFSGGHVPYALLALLVLVVFVVTPTIFLLLLPMKTFKKLLSVSRLDGPTLQAIGDAFIGCFKDGSSKGNSDGRFFAGLFLIFRLFFVALYTIPDGSEFSFYRIIYLTEEGIGLAVAGLIILYRPYKCNTSNVLDFFMFLYLGFLALVCAVSFGNYNVAIAEYGPLYLPAFFLACWLVYLITKRIVCEMCARKLIAATASNEEHEDEDSKGPEYVLVDSDDDTFPDRLQNPEDYSEVHSSAEPIPARSAELIPARSSMKMSNVLDYSV